MKEYMLFYGSVSIVMWNKRCKNMAANCGK